MLSEEARVLLHSDFFNLRRKTRCMTGELSWRMLLASSCIYQGHNARPNLIRQPGLWNCHRLQLRSNFPFALSTSPLLFSALRKRLRPYLAQHMLVGASGCARSSCSGRGHDFRLVRGVCAAPRPKGFRFLFLPSTLRVGSSLLSRAMASAERPLLDKERPHMYRIWYMILIKQVCRTAKGSPRRRPERYLQKDGKPTAFYLMHQCLDAWAASLSEALSGKITENWTQDQYEKVYQELYVLGKKTWMKMYMPLSDRPSRREIVEFVVRDLITTLL